MERKFPKVFDIQDVNMNQNLDHLVELPEVVTVDGTRKIFTDEDIDSLETVKKLDELNSSKDTPNKAFWYIRRGAKLQE